MGARTDPTVVTFPCLRVESGWRWFSLLWPMKPLVLHSLPRAGWGFAIHQDQDSPSFSLLCDEGPSLIPGIILTSSMHCACMLLPTTAVACSGGPQVKINFHHNKNNWRDHRTLFAAILIRWRLTWQYLHTAKGCPPGPKLIPCPLLFSHVAVAPRRCLLSSPPYADPRPCKAASFPGSGQALMSLKL